MESAEGRAGAQVRNIGDVPFVFLAMKNVDMVVFHDSSRKVRLFSSTISKELAHLIRLGFSVDLLEVQRFANVVMNQNVVAAARSRKSEPECAGELKKVSEIGPPRMPPGLILSLFKQEYQPPTPVRAPR